MVGQFSGIVLLLRRGTPYRRRSRILLRFGGKSVRIRSPRLEWAPNLLRCGSEYYWLLGLAVGDGVASGAGVTFEVSIRICQSSPSRITDQYPLIGVGPKFWP